MTEHGESSEAPSLSRRVLYTVIFPMLCAPVIFFFAASPSYHRLGMEALIGLAIFIFYLPRWLAIVLVADLLICWGIAGSRGRLFVFGMLPNVVLFIAFIILCMTSQEALLRYAVDH